MTDADRQFYGGLLEGLWRQTSALVDAVMKSSGQNPAGTSGVPTVTPAACPEKRNAYGVND